MICIMPLLCAPRHRLPASHLGMVKRPVRIASVPIAQFLAAHNIHAPDSDTCPDDPRLCTSLTVGCSLSHPGMLPRLLELAVLPDVARWWAQCCSIPPSSSSPTIIWASLIDADASNNWSPIWSSSSVYGSYGFGNVVVRFVTIFDVVRIHLFVA